MEYREKQFLRTDKRRLWICGDIHGEIKRLVHDAIHQLKIKCADILVVGDFRDIFNIIDTCDTPFIIRTPIAIYAFVA